MHCNVYITDKEGNRTMFERTVLKVTIDRRLDAQTASAHIVVNDSIKKVKNLYSFTGITGIISNGNKVEIYFIVDGKEKIQFVGIIRNFELNDIEKTVSIECHDLACKILRPIDGAIPCHCFDNLKATQLISQLAEKAGLEKTQFNILKERDYVVKDLKIQYDTQISDIIDETLATLEARARVLKDGTYKVEKLYPNYKSSDVQAKINYDWIYEDFIRIGSLNRKRSSETLYNRVLVRFSDSIYDVFEDPDMLKYVGYKTFKEVNNALADTQGKRRLVANRFFLDAWRRNSSIDIIATKGNPGLDLGQTVRLEMDGHSVGHYMVTGIRTDYEPGNYVDQIALDGMREVVDIAKLSSGNYTIEDGKDSKGKKGKKKRKDIETTFQIVKQNIIEKFKIENSGKTKIGFIDIDKQPYLEVKAFFNSSIETKHYDLVIQDPNKAFYGYKQQILGDVENQISKTGLNSCKKIDYSGWKGQPEYFKISNPIKGRWYIYIQSDTKEDYTANLSVNLDWKKVKIDETK